MAKIFILTLPFNDNYGGVIQAAALQRTVRNIGIDDCKIYKWVPPSKKLRQRLGWLFYYIKNRKLPFASMARLLKGRFHYFRSFMRKNMRETSLFFPRITSAKNAKTQWIIGSDQVWRFFDQYHPEFFVLDFLPRETRANSFSYAASFGVSKWDLDAVRTASVSRLASELKSVSVREEAGKELCSKYMGIKAEVVPDPTLLLEAREYEEMIKGGVEKYPKDYAGAYIAYYILDMTPGIRQMIDTFAAQTGLPSVNMMHNPALDATGVLKRPIEQWIDVVKNAKFLITDSFHGTVFAIIFHTDFVVLNNKKRGSSRFETLLGKLGMGDRMYDETDALTLRPVAPEKWVAVDAELQAMRKKGVEYIKSNINEHGFNS